MGIGEESMIYELNNNASVLIEKGEWHMGCNMTDKPAHIVEIWRGNTEELTEKDIERIQSEWGKNEGKKMVELESQIKQ